MWPFAMKWICSLIRGQFAAIHAPSPKEPEKTNITVIRDSSEDVYSGIEWQAGSVDNERILDFCVKKWSNPTEV